MEHPQYLSLLVSFGGYYNKRHIMPQQHTAQLVVFLPFSQSASSSRKRAFTTLKSPDAEDEAAGVGESLEYGRRNISFTGRELNANLLRRIRNPEADRMVTRA